MPAGGYTQKSCRTLTAPLFQGNYPDQIKNQLSLSRCPGSLSLYAGGESEGGGGLITFHKPGYGQWNPFLRIGYVLSV